MGGANPNSSFHPGSSELSAQLLVDFVAGRLGGQAADIDIASKIARYVFWCFFFSLHMCKQMEFFAIDHLIFVRTIAHFLF